MTNGIASSLNNPAVAFGLAAVCFVYPVPAVVAIVRLREYKLKTVPLVNLLVGWTVVGWLVALVMALRGPTAVFAKADGEGGSEIPLPMVIRSPAVSPR